MSNRPLGSLPNNIEENPKGVNAIMLRSGKELEVVDRKVHTQKESPKKDKGKVKMEEDKEVPMILGKPFLVTGKTLIDIK